MSTIPERVTEGQFQSYIMPFLSIAKRGYISKTPLVGIFNLILYRLHNGCQWDCLPVSSDAAERERRQQPSWQGVYDHWSKWSADGCLEKVWQASIVQIKPDLDLQQMNLDGSHAVAKKGWREYDLPSA